MICIIGFGNFGTAMAYNISKNNFPVTIYTRNDDVVVHFNENQLNKKYLTSTKLDNVTVTSSINDVLHSNVEILILCIPAQTIKSFLSVYKDLISNSTLVVNCAKGLSFDDDCNISQVITSILPLNTILTMQGPSFAQEIVQDHPTEVVIASSSHAAAIRLQEIMTTSSFKAVISHDIVGTEVAGALKNCYALGAGFIIGSKFGNNTLASFITRAFQEQVEFIRAVSKDCPKESVNVATLGDLIMTCYGSLSRNKMFGIMLAKGEKDLNPKTVEGVATIKVAIKIADKLQLSAPILRGINDVLERDQSSNETMKLTNLI